MTTPNFKNTKFYYNSYDEARIIQEAAFKLGFRWGYTRTGTVRRVLTSLVPGSTGYILVDKDCRMYSATAESGYINGAYQAAFVHMLVAAAQFKRAADRAKRKASRKKKAADNYVEWTAKDAAPYPNKLSGPCPLPTGTKFVVKIRGFQDYRDGVVTSPHYRWNHLDCDGDIIGYKIIEQAKNPRNLRKSLTVEESLVSLESMVATIVADAGGVEVTPHDADGYIVWNGGPKPVAAGTLIDVKFRDPSSWTTLIGIPAGDDMTKDTYWENDGFSCDIVAYRLSKPAVALAVTYVAVEPDTNPKRQYGVQSIPLSYWSPLASAYGALGLYNGALKYGKGNFANTKVEASIYIDAAMRHLSAWAQGEELDPADGVPNLGGVLANVAILLEARAAGTLVDDRTLWSGYVRERDSLKPIVKGLNILHADKSPKHYTRETV